MKKLFYLFSATLLAFVSCTNDYDTSCFKKNDVDPIKSDTISPPKTDSVPVVIVEPILLKNWFILMQTDKPLHLNYHMTITK